MKLKNYLIEVSASKLTDLYETAACMGIVASPKIISMVDKVINNETVDVKELASEFIKIVKSNYDWNTSGVSQVINICDNVESQTKNFGLICGLLKGMSNFIEFKNLSGYYFVHNDIKEYYKIEKKRLGSIKGSKANTADCIICSVPAAQFLKKMETGDIKPKKTHIEVDDIIYYQISLKKSHTEAQLGKVGNFLRKNLDFGVKASQGLQSLSNESYFNNQQLINENVFKKIKGVISSVFDKIKKKIDSILNKITSKYKSIFSRNKVNPKYIAQLHSKLGINEALKATGSFKDLKNKKNIALVTDIIKNPSKTIKVINKELKLLSEISDSNNYIAYDLTLLPELKKLKGDQILEAYALIANYCSILTLKDMLKDEKNLEKNVKRLIAEMFFGGTKLPLWKVYGDFGNGKSYEFLGTIDTFIEKGMDDLSIELIGWRFSPYKNHYSTKFVMLNTVNQDTKSYIIFRMGTNSASRISFNFEGTSIDTIKLDESINKILQKKV